MPASKLNEYNQIKSGRRNGGGGKWDPEHYTKYPHEFEYLIRGNKLGTPTQHAVLYIIGRHTVGTTERPEWAKISMRQLARECGDVETKNVFLAVRDLSKRGIIEVRERTGCVGKRSSSMYRWRHESWKDAPSYHAPTRAEICEAEAEAAPEPEEIDPRPETMPMQETVALDVAPGKPSRVQHAVYPKGSSDPVKINIVYHHNFDFPVTFQCRSGPNGYLEIDTSCSRARLQSFANPSPSFVENNDLAKYRAYISATVMKTWGKAADGRILSDTIAAAQGTPFTYFETIVEQKLHRRGARERHTAGLLPQLAKDAFAAWQAALNTQHTEDNSVTVDERPLTAAEILYLTEVKASEPCPTCNGTGKKGIWDRGKFRELKSGKCKECGGNGKSSVRREEMR